MKEALDTDLTNVQLAGIVMENWPGEMYTNTLTTRGRVMEESGKDAVIITQPAVVANEDGSEEFLDVIPEIKTILKGRELRTP